jgi:hypothetical protein
MCPRAGVLNVKAYSCFTEISAVVSTDNSQECLVYITKISTPSLAFMYDCLFSFCLYFCHALCTMNCLETDIKCRITNLKEKSIKKVKVHFGL